jgi:prolyl 4-hydroxylase
MIDPVAHPEADKAAILDSGGNHDAAIECLARGTKAGDALCTELLGIRLLTSDRAPHLPADALGLLAEAAAKGRGEGAARAAGVVALGVGQAPNWQQALGWLCLSAEAGWEPSQRQLRALADDRTMARRTLDSNAATWRALAQTVDLASWRKSLPAEFMSRDPVVAAAVGLARPELCEFFISQAAHRLEAARVYDPVNRQDIVVAHRSNTHATFDLRRVEFAHVLLQARMSAICGIPVQHLEAPAVLHYAAGEQISDHFDFVDPHSVPDYPAEIARNGQRVVTFLLYLNESYEGGETDFPKLGISHRGRTGCGLYFVNALADLTPDLRTLHAGRPPSSGEKWIITQFARSRPMR